MEKIIGVRFRSGSKLYYFSPNGLPVAKGDDVIVETVRGVECGKCVTDIHETDEANIVQPLKPIIRIATADDLKQVEALKEKEKKALQTFDERIAHHGLEMSSVNVEYTFDESKIVFYFTADGRVDFRDLVKDMAGMFHTRIELCQIGVRDETKMMGGLGSCGRVCCCNAYLGEFQPVSIKMAKEQGLSLNPVNISGLCGRLMCCLKYEQSCYEEARKSLPKVGAEVATPNGNGTVVELMPLPQKVRVKVELEDGTFDMSVFHVSEISPADKSAQPAQAPKAEAKPADNAPKDKPNNDSNRNNNSNKGDNRHNSKNNQGNKPKNDNKNNKPNDADKNNKPEGVKPDGNANKGEGNKSNRNRNRRRRRGNRSNNSGDTANKNNGNKPTTFTPEN